MSVWVGQLAPAEMPEQARDLLMAPAAPSRFGRRRNIFRQSSGKPHEAFSLPDHAMNYDDDATRLTTELALLLALSTLWGASYAFIKIGVETIPPLTLIAARPHRWSVIAGDCSMAWRGASEGYRHLASVLSAGLPQ